MTDRCTRFDRATPAKIQRTPQGGLRVDARVTRTGIFEYETADGQVIREYRPADVVFDAASLETLAYAPVTDLHPSAMVDSTTWRAYAVGHVTESVVQDGEFVNATLVIQDANMIAKIDTGDRKEISCGYTCTVVPRVGEFDGQRYDAVQTNIVYNHVAIGPEGWGRAGSEVRLRLDSKGNAIDPYQEKRMPEEKKDEGASVEEEKPTMDMAGVLAKLDEILSRLPAKQDGIVGPNSEEEEKKEDTLDAKVHARLAVIDRARGVLGAEFKFDGKTDRAIMEECLTARKVELPTEASDDFVAGAFAQLKPETRNDALANVRTVETETPTEKVDYRVKALEASHSAWKSKK